MTNIFLYIICIIILIITIPFFLIYLANKKYHNYLSRFNIIFTSIVFFNMLIRIIPLSRADGINSDDISGFCKVQAFLLSLFDKSIATFIVSFSIITYIDTFKKDKEKEKKEYQMPQKPNDPKYFYLNISLAISFILSMILSVIFLTQGTSDRSEFCYVETKSSVKLWIDSIVTGILYIINLVLTLIMVFFAKNIGEDEEKKFYKSDFILFYLRLVFNLITLTYVFYLIIRILPFKGYKKDLIYIILCLIVNILFVANYELKNYIKKIFCCNDDNNDNNNNNNNDNYDYNINDNDNDNDSNNGIILMKSIN